MFSCLTTKSIKTNSKLATKLCHSYYIGKPIWETIQDNCEAVAQKAKFCIPLRYSSISVITLIILCNHELLSFIV